MLDCIEAGKTKKCDAMAKVCKWKKKSDGAMEQMCGTKNDTEITKTMCVETMDGTMHCTCNTPNCNADCKPGMCKDVTGMNTKATEKMSPSTMKPTKADPDAEPEPGPEPEPKMDLINGIMDMMPKKICEDAVCTATTVSNGGTHGTKANGKTTIANDPKTSTKMVDKGATTSNSPVTKTAVHVVIGFFILITPFFN